MILSRIYVDDVIKNALQEDINHVDITTDLLINELQESTASIISKNIGLACGVDVALRVFKLLDDDCTVEVFKGDGAKIGIGDVIAKVKGRTVALLKGERTALNLLQHMCGVATSTARAVSLCARDDIIVTETRKTLPGLRGLQKYAVLVGGGRNHRYNLSDAVMIKDNHIAACGSITKAVEVCKESVGHLTKIEVEAKNLEEVKEAVAAKADVVMLDNMDVPTMRKAVKLCGKRVMSEASGNVNEMNIRLIADTGVNIISIGALTHSVKAFDISMLID